MMGNRSRCGAERVEEPVRHPGTEEQLEECMDILEDLDEYSVCKVHTFR